MQEQQPEMITFLTTVFSKMDDLKNRIDDQDHPDDI